MPEMPNPIFLENKKSISECFLLKCLPSMLGFTELEKLCLEK